MKFPDLDNLKRINVIGTSGCGKSTFSIRLADTLDLPLTHMDRLFWKPNWTESSDQEMFTKLESVVQQPEWILDGNYSRTQPIKWREVQTIIWIDMPFFQTFKQITFRSIHRAWKKPELWPGTGNRESFRRTFLSRKSIILWMLTNFQRNRQRYQSLMENPPKDSIHCLRLRSNKEVESFFEYLRTKSD